MTDSDRPIRVSVVATPDAMVSPVSGLYEVLGSVRATAASVQREPSPPEVFRIEIVAESAGSLNGASGLSISAHRSIDDVRATDIVIVPSMTLRADGDWVPGRYPRLVAWIREMHAGGATICAACSGGMLTAETGLLDGHEATMHWISEEHFRRRHPTVELRLDAALVVSGEGGRLVTSGASTAWHDLALYLVAKYAGRDVAQSVARFLLMQWHHDGQMAYQVFHPPMEHGDAAVLTAQRWLDSHHAVASPVDEMGRRSGLLPRTFKRRFKAATGHTPIGYVQRVRVEHAKRMLESSAEPVEEVSWAVGYEDAASFRRLFRRVVGMSPGEYRRRFRVPEQV